METGPLESTRSAQASFIQLEVIGFSCKSFDENLKALVKHLFIFNSAMYITKSLNGTLWANAETPPSEALLEESQLVLDKIPFSNVNMLSFGALEKFLKLNKFPIKITTTDSKNYYIELAKEDYLYLRKTFGEGSTHRKASRSKKFLLTQNVKDRLAQMDTFPFVPSLFKLIVVDHQLMQEDQFHRILFDRPELNILVQQKSSEKSGGFRYLANRVHERCKRGKFKVDYILPDLWNDQQKLLMVDDQEQDLLQTVAVPQLDKVGPKSE